MNTHRLSQFIKRYSKVTQEIIVSIFVLIFVYAALTKLIEGDRFYNNLNNSPIFESSFFASTLSWLIPFLEIVVSLFVIKPKTRIIGLYGALGLMLVFTTYVGGIVFYSPYIPCSCGGVISLLSWPQHLILNICLLALAILGILLYKKRKKLTNSLYYQSTGEFL